MIKKFVMVKIKKHHILNLYFYLIIYMSIILWLISFYVVVKIVRSQILGLLK